MSDAVLTEAAGGVLLITLNRPEARNAVNLAIAEGVAAALDRLDAEPGLQVGSSPAPGRRSARAWTSRRSSPASARGSTAAGSPGSSSGHRASR